jgi:hypothetical protein
MEITVDLGIQDWKKYQAYIEKNISSKTKMWFDSSWFNTILWFVIAIVFFTFIQGTDKFNWPTAGIVTFFFVFIYIQLLFSGIKFKKGFEPLEGGSFCRRHIFKFDDNGIHSEGDDYQCSQRWSLVQRIERTDEAIYIFIDSAMAYIFPTQQLENPDEFYEFILNKQKI